jgi:hypothetical protein
MNRGARVLGATLVAIAVCGVSATESQESAAKIAVDLGTADGPPGSTVFVPVNIAVPDEESVTRLELDVGFDKTLVSFVRADETPQAKVAGVSLSTSIGDDSQDRSRSILHVTATAAKGFTTSAIVDLFFRVSAEAKPSGSTSHKAGTITTVLEKTARVGTTVGQLSVAEGRDGEIDITEGVALFGCFFYIH